MQFRAGVFYIVLFSVIAAGAYAVIATADAPEATIDEADATETLSVNDSFTQGDRTYTVTEIGEVEAGGGGGGHGGGGGGHSVMAGTFEYVNDSGVIEREWAHEDTVELEDGTEYTVIVEESEDENETPSFTLRESFDEEEYNTTELNGETQVVLDNNGTTELVPIDEFEEIDSRTYEVGDTVSFNDSETGEVVDAEVTEIASETVTVQWRGETTTEYEVQQGDTVTLNGQEYVAYYPNGEEVRLSTDVESFEQQEQEVEAFHERITGLWWVIAMAATTIILLAGLAFMPVRG